MILMGCQFACFLIQLMICFFERFFDAMLIMNCFVCLGGVLRFFPFMARNIFVASRAVRLFPSKNG